MKPSAGKLIGYAGAAIGILGWLIGFSVFCLATGRTDLLGRIFLPGLMISLIMAAVVVLVMEFALQRFGPNPMILQLSLWGLLTSMGGLLLFLANHWLAPLIELNPAVARDLAKMNSTYRVDDRLPIILMAAGAIMLIVLTVLVLKKGTGGLESDHDQS